MTATSEVRFGADGAAKVQSYVRLTDSTNIRCCTYDDAKPVARGPHAGCLCGRQCRS